MGTPQLPQSQVVWERQSLNELHICKLSYKIVKIILVDQSDTTLIKSVWETHFQMYVPIQT